jgi:seryl-tRNA synthetase
MIPAITLLYKVNAIQKQITEKKKASKGQDKCEDLLAEKTKAEEKVAEQQKVADELKVRRLRFWYLVRLV